MKRIDRFKGPLDELGFLKFERWSTIEKTAWPSRRLTASARTSNLRFRTCWHIV